MAPHFLLDHIDEAGDIVILSGAEARHAAVVRRVRVGEEVTVSDGTGLWCTTHVESVAPGEVLLRVDARVFIDAPSPQVTLVQALAKGDRDELAIQAACELGVDAVVPWQAERSISQWIGIKAGKGRSRWESIVREAAKQAHRAWVPDVAEVAATAGIADLAGRTRMLVLDPAAPVALSELAFDRRNVSLVVGPEGGITAEELDALSAAGAARVRLGSTVLRTSTAGPAALAVISVALGRW